MTANNKPLNTKGADTALKIQKLLKSLIECMSQETLAIKAQKQDIAAKMNEEKSRLLPHYQSIAKELKENPSLLREADEDVRKQLSALMAEFSAVMNENIMTIQTGRTAVSRLIERLLNKAREAVNKSGRRYNAKGKLVEQNATGNVIQGQLNSLY